MVVNNISARRLNLKRGFGFNNMAREPVSKIREQISITGFHQFADAGLGQYLQYRHISKIHYRLGAKKLLYFRVGSVYIEFSLPALCHEFSLPHHVEIPLPL